MENKSKDALEQIRPFLQRAGGDIEYVDYTTYSMSPPSL